MPPAVTGTSSPGNFQALKGENCTLLKVRGIKILEDEHGVDLLKLLRRSAGATGSSELEAVVSTLIQRLDVVEKYLQTLSSAPPAASGVKGPKGDTGPPGADGADGPPGIQGPRGKGASKVSEVGDVNLDGLDDGAVLVWSAKEKKWVVSLEEQ